LERAIKSREDTIGSLEKILHEKERGFGELSSEAQQKMDHLSVQMNQQLSEAKEDAVKMKNSPCNDDMTSSSQRQESF